MLENPKHGWVKIHLGDFCDRASYLTDVPHDLLDKFNNMFEKHGSPVAVGFDAEGWEYIIVFDWYTTYIIESKDTEKLYVFDKCFIDLQPIDNQSVVWIGVDLSSVGEDRTVVSIINKNNNVEQYIREGELDEKYKKIADIINKYSKLQKCYIETNGVGSPMTNEIKKLVKYKNKIEEFITTNSTKKEIVGLLQTKIANKEILFDKKNTLLFSEFGTFIYTISKSNNIIFNAQDGKHDDTVMSLAIALKAKEDIIHLDVQKDVHFIRTRVKNIG